jgi:hypothetical protein
MQLAAINKARTLAFIELDDLNRNGKLRLADIAPQLVQRYDFKNYPQPTDILDVDDKGIVFASGKFGSFTIGEFKIYSGLIYAEALSSTDESTAFILDLLDWGTKELGFTCDEKTIRHWAYVSSLSFHSEFPLLKALSGPMTRLAEKTGNQVSSFFGEEIPYHPMISTAGHDPRIRKNGIAPFTIQQRSGVQFAENKFFSEAPLPTHVHIQYLEELEAEVNANESR